MHMQSLTWCPKDNIRVAIGWVGLVLYWIILIMDG